MAMTSEERSTYPLCGAKKKNGEECRAFAGQGTSHFGVGRCKYHGGSTPSHQTNAARKEVERHMATMGAPLRVSPAQALKGLLQATAGHVAWLAAEVAELGNLEGPEAVSLTTLYADERDRLTRIAKACLDSGIGKAEVEMAEAQTQALAKAINAAFSHVGGLTQQQKRQFGQALRQELAALSASQAEQVPATSAGSLEPIAA